VRSVIPDAVSDVAASQRTVLPCEGSSFRPHPESSAYLPVGCHTRDCA
jgi:hypothetical protein